MKNSKTTGKRIGAAIGTGLIGLVIVVALMITLPGLFGIKLYNVTTGSMEPAIPIGSLIAVKYEEPDQIHAQDIIAFEHRGSVVTHRVVENDQSSQQFITRGDANAQNDFEPVPYIDLIGVLKMHVPVIGAFFAWLSTMSGKLFLLALAAVGALMNLMTGLKSSKEES